MLMYLKKINFNEIEFRVDLFSWMQLLLHPVWNFLFADGEISIVSRGLIFVVARYVMFMSSLKITGKKQISVKLPKTYWLHYHHSPLCVIQSVKKGELLFLLILKPCHKETSTKISQKLISRKLIFTKINLFQIGVRILWFFPWDCHDSYCSE